MRYKTCIHTYRVSLVIHGDNKFLSKRIIYVVINSSMINNYRTYMAHPVRVVLVEDNCEIRRSERNQVVNRTKIVRQTREVCDAFVCTRTTDNTPREFDPFRRVMEGGVYAYTYCGGGAVANEMRGKRKQRRGGVCVHNVCIAHARETRWRAAFYAFR